MNIMNKIMNINIFIHIAALVCFLINGGVAVIMMYNKLIINHTFNALYMNMVACECFNLLILALWEAPLTYLYVFMVAGSNLHACILFNFFLHFIINFVVTSSRWESASWDVKSV